MARGVGATLQSLGQAQQQDAMSVLGNAAEQENRRNIQNEQIEQQQKAGKTQLGTMLGGLGGFALGAKVGAVGGPMGALIGGAVGAIAGGLFD